MASFDEAFKFPLTQKIMTDNEHSEMNVFARGSYVPLRAAPYKSKTVISQLKMYNTEFSLKEYQQCKKNGD